MLSNKNDGANNTYPDGRNRPMLHRSLLAAGVAASLALGLQATDLSAQEVNLRYAHVGAEGDIQYWYGAEAAERIPEVTDA